MRTLLPGVVVLLLAVKLIFGSSRMADKIFPGKYQSDFAVQVTLQITDV